MIERRFYWKYRDATQTGWVRERKVGADRWVVYVPT